MKPKDAVTRLEARDAAAPVVLSCEHASERLPAPWRWPESDLRLIGTHWTHDLGAEALTHELSERLGAAALLSRFTRLLVDPNRPLDAATLCRAEAEGEPVALNRELSDREARLAYWHAYHDALDALVASTQAPVLFAIHTFTPLYEGSRREFELGVLFDEEERLGLRLHEHLLGAGFASRLNEPYSGKEGLIFAAHRHASARGRGAIELEVRQDLAVDGDYRARLTACLARFDFAR